MHNPGIAPRECEAVSFSRLCNDGPGRIPVNTFLTINWAKIAEWSRVSSNA
jgi:hypothetical protein